MKFTMVRKEHWSSSINFQSADGIRLIVNRIQWEALGRPEEITVSIGEEDDKKDG